jgi:hypothetical protein
MRIQRTLIGLLVLLCSCRASGEPASSGAGPSRVECDDVDPSPVGSFDPPTHLEGDRVVMPVTFSDGSTAELTYPESVDLAGLGALARTEGHLDGAPETGRDLTIVPGDAGDWTNVGAPTACYQAPDGVHAELRPTRDDPDVRYYLLFRFGPWTAFTWDGNAGQGMTDEQRALWALSLEPVITGDGWPVLETAEPLRLGAESFGDVQLEFGNVGERGVLMWPVGCSPREDDHTEAIGSRSVSLSREAGAGQWFADWCMPEGPMIVHVYADRAFIVSLAEGLEVRDVRLAYPADRYHIVP